VAGSVSSRSKGNRREGQLFVFFNPTTEVRDGKVFIVFSFL
jgi:hypothetical protein